MILPTRTFLLIAAAVVLSAPGRAQDLGRLNSEEARALQADALFIDATKARMLDDQKREEELLKQVVKARPNQAAPYYNLAVLYRKQSRIDQAEQNIRKAVSLEKQNPWYRQEFARVLELQGKFEEAAEIYHALGEEQRFNAEFFLESAKLYQKAGKTREAVNALDRLLQRSGPDIGILLQKQQMHLRLNDLDGAVKVAQELIDQNPREAQFYANLAELYNSNDQPEKAIQIYEKALKDFPDDPSIQLGLAEYYKKRDDTAKYREYIRKAIFNPNFDSETQFAVLVSYLQQLGSDTGRRTESVEITGELVKQQSDNPQLLALYGELLRLNGDEEGAAREYKRALRYDPARFDVWQSLLFLYTGAKDADSLVKYSEQAMRYFPNQAIVHYLQGIGHFNRKSFMLAIKSINRAIDLQPEDNEAMLSQMYASLGDIYNEIKEYQRSDSSYERALQLDKDNASVLNNYSYYLSLRGERLQDAERMSKRSLELRPGEATFLDTYGWILYRQGKYEQAKKYIEDALKANPDADGTLWDHIGDVYFKLGDVEKAVEHWKIAKEKGTENQQIDRKIQGRKLYE